MPWDCNARHSRALGLALMLPGLLAAEPAAVTVVVDSPQQASRRLQTALNEAGCPAQVVDDDADQAGVLRFRYTERTGAGVLPVLIAVGRDGRVPVPVWVTRRTAGVRTLAELQGRDLSLVSAGDPVGSQAPLTALQGAGVSWKAEQLYRTEDYVSALGLLLHNNTHGAASEAALVAPFLEPQGLAITWRGEPLAVGGWYLAETAPSGARACVEALVTLHRDRHPQAFQAFPGWVFSFRPH